MDILNESLYNETASNNTTYGNLELDNVTATSETEQNTVCSSEIDCVYLVVVPIISVFGIVGNFFSLKVFLFTNFRKQPSCVYLIALSISDTGFLLALFASWLGRPRFELGLAGSLIYCFFVVYTTYVCSFLSVWYIVLIMIDRYIVVCHPLKVQLWCTRTRCIKSAICLAIIAVLLYSFSFFTSDVVNGTCYIKNEAIHAVIMFTYIDTAITFLIPILLVFVLNVIVIVSIKKFRRQQILISFQEETSVKPQNNVLSAAQFRVTTMLVVVSVVFLLTNLPSHAIRVYIMINGLLNKDPVISVSNAQQISNLLYFANFSINFLLYSTSSRVFRKYLCLGSNYGMIPCRSSQTSKTSYYKSTLKKSRIVHIYVKNNIAEL